MGNWVKTKDNQVAAYWKSSSNPLRGDPEMMDVSDHDGPFMGRAYDQAEDRFIGPPYEVLIASDKSQIRADGADFATITAQTVHWSGTIEDFNDTLTLWVDGTEQVVMMTGGQGTLEINSLAEKTIEIRLKETSDFQKAPRYLDLRIEAA